MKKILFVVLFIVFLVSPSHAFNPLVVCSGQPVASEETFSFAAADAVYVICSDAYWTTNATAYDAANVDGHYETLAAWQTARDGEDTADQNSIAILHGLISLTSSYQHTGWTNKSAGYYFIFQYDPVLGNAADGTRDGSGDGLTIDVDSGYPLRFDEARVWFKKIKIIDSGGSSTNSLIANPAGSNPFYVEGCFFYFGRSCAGNAAGIYLLDSSGSAYFWNNMFTGDGLASADYMIRNEQANQYLFIYANSIYTTTGRGLLSNANTKVRNNANFANSVNYGGITDVDYEVTNASSGAGANSTHSLSASDVFIDTTMSTADLHLDIAGDSYSDANGQGTDLRSDGDLAVTDDIDGDTRASAPNIGADE